MHCPECGAPWRNPDECSQRFHHFLTLEFSDPAYGTVHHLTVLAYMLQHPSQLSQRGWQAMRGLLSHFLFSDLSPSDVRTRNRELLDSGNRSWSIKKGSRLQLPKSFSWTQTILAVPDSHASEYCKGIEQWARHVLEDTAVLEAGGAE